MVDYVLWSFSDPLTLEQAACLWVGITPEISPGLLISRPRNEREAIAPRFEMLRSAVRSGKLPVDRAATPLDMILDYNSVLVSRENLMAFALSIGERPAFLFDTLTQQRGGADISAIAGSTRVEATRNKGGRPREFNWDAFMYRIVELADLDHLPDKQADLVRKMQEWFVETHGREPAESMTKKRISDLYNALGRGQKPTSR